MNEALIRNFNEIITPQDTVICLGDFSFKDPAPFLNRLNGNWALVKGNHDPKQLMNKGYAWVKDVHTVNIDGQSIFMSHYAHRTWNKAHHGAWHLFGHDHGGRIWAEGEVGVDAWHYKPVSIEQLQARFKDRENVKHH
jgi:calcineurin-like phosphoesterase family protein